MIDFYKDNGFYVFNNSVNSELIEESNAYLNCQENLDLWDSQEKLKPNNSIIKKFYNLPVTKKILNEIVSNNFTVLAEWFLVKRSFLITHRDAIFFPYHIKDVRNNIPHKLWLSNDFSYKYINIIFYLTDEKEGYEYFNVPKTHLLDIQNYKKYFTACSYYENNNEVVPKIISLEDSIKQGVKAAFTNCSCEEYEKYNSLVPYNKNNLSFYSLKKGDVLLQSGSIIHGSYGEMHKNTIKNAELRKSFIIRLISNDYFSIR